MPLFSEHISNMYYGGSSSYSAPYSYKSSVLPFGGSYSASYLSPGSSYSNHSSLGGYSRAPVTSRWTPSSGRNYSPILSTISERSTSSPSRITSPRRIPLLKRSYNSSSYISRPININTADIDVSRNKYTARASYENQEPPQSESNANAENGPFMPRVDGKPETGIDSSPGEHQRSTIKRGRTVVRLHTIKRKERDSPKKGDFQQQENEETGETSSGSKVIESEESLGWRERLSEDLVYKDKREKKTLGAKLVEKFIVKDNYEATEAVAKRSPKTETAQNTTESVTTSLPKRVSPDRRYSMELLEEQANFLDSMIRNENLSTAPLDISKVGISEHTDLLSFTGSTKRRKASNDKNPLQTTKSDHSLHDRINSLKEPKDFSKQRSLKKSLSGGSIRRLASITEFPKETTSNNSLPAIEEIRLSIKKENTKKDLKVKAKRIPKITSSVEITESVSSPKFKVENITVEEKAVSSKKDITYSSTIDINLERDDVTQQSDNDSRKIKIRYSSKRKTKPLFRGNSDEGSPEPDDGNFWGKIGKRETVYLMKRKQFIEDAKEKHRRAMFWFEDDDDSLDSTLIPCDSNMNKSSVTLYETDNIKIENILSNQEGSHNKCDATSNAESMKITSLSLVHATQVKEQNHDRAPPVDDVRFTRNSIKNTYLSKNSVTTENKTLEAKLAKIENESNVFDNTNNTMTEKPQPVSEISIKFARGSPENTKQLPKSEHSQAEPALTIEPKGKETIEPQENEKVTNKLIGAVHSKNIHILEIKNELPGISKSDETYSSKQQTVKDFVKDNKDDEGENISPSKELIVDSESQEISMKSEEKTTVSQNYLSEEQNSVSNKDKTMEETQQGTVSHEDAIIDLKNKNSNEEPNTKTTKINDTAEEIKPLSTSSILNQIENIPKTGNDVISVISPEELKVGEDKKADNILDIVGQKSTEQLSPITPVMPVTSPRKPVKVEAAIRPLIATPRPLQKKVPQVVQSSSSEDTSSEEDTSEDEDADDSDTSGGSTEFFECETNTDGRTSTGSNDSGFDSSAPASPAGFINAKKDCDVNCHRKCEKLTANLCGVNQRLLVEALACQSASKRGGDSPGPSSASAPAAATEMLEKELEQSTAYSLFRKTGRFTPPAKSIPRFRKYNIDDFQFIKVLGKGSFGKVLLAELRDTEYYYAVKCLKKDVVLEDDDVECTLIERKVLALGTNHPYLCHLFATFQTDCHLFFVMEYLNGGDLMFHIQQSGRFPEARARFYAAEIVSGLKFLHKRGIVYRDLKLDNILLDYEGHVRIADFGMCKLQIYLEKTADTFCGTPDYMAPEIIKGLKYNQTVDWWSFGVLLYEMLIGQSPFSGCDEDELFWSICNEMPSYPRFLSQEALTILTRLLDKDSRTRMGGTDCMHGDIRDQDFFRPVHWDRLERRELETPFKPRVRHPLDTQYFDRAFTGERPRLTTVEPNVLRSMDQGPFRGFSYTNPNATDR